MRTSPRAIVKIPVSVVNGRADGATAYKHPEQQERECSGERHLAQGRIPPARTGSLDSA